MSRDGTTRFFIFETLIIEHKFRRPLFLVPTYPSWNVLYLPSSLLWLLCAAESSQTVNSSEFFRKSAHIFSLRINPKWFHHILRFFTSITSYFHLTIIRSLYPVLCCNLPVHESRILGNGRQCTVDPARPKIMLFERTIERTRIEAVKCKWSLGQYCSIPVYKRCRRIKLCPTKLMECKLKL